MSYGFRILVDGEYASFNRPELKVERVSYDVPTPGALEGLLKGIYWKPALRYVIDKIVVFHPIQFANIRRNEVKDTISYQSVRSQMNGEDKSPVLYTGENRSQRAAMVLKNVRYGIAFHFELTGLKSEGEADGEKKHYNIIKRRLTQGQCFRHPCLGCSEFPVKKIELVERFPLEEISPAILAMGDVDLGYMCYRVSFQDGGIPVNGDWDAPKFSDKAEASYYRPHMVGGIIDVAKYRGDLIC